MRHTQRNMFALTSLIPSLLFFDLPPVAKGQLSLASCSSTFSWMDNQKLQDPCEVAAYLISPCLQDPAEATVYALEPGPTVNFYTPPGEDVEGSVGATACVCSTVFYSVISACGVCQGDSFVSWTNWEASCSTVYVSQYPAQIPSAISVPAWAYLDVTKANNFSVAAAQAEAAKNDPDIIGDGASATPLTHSTVSAGSIPTGGGVLSTPSGFSIPLTGSFAPTIALPSTTASTSFSGDGSTSKKKTNIGPIVGGVVGGVAGLAIIGGVLWYWLTHRNAAAPVSSAATAVSVPQTAYDVIPPGTPDPEKLAASAVPPPTPQPHDAIVPDIAYTQQAQPPPPAPLPLYNPDDPSTFPDVFASSPVHSVQPTSSPSLQPPSPHSVQPISTSSLQTPSPPPASNASGYVPTVY